MAALGVTVRARDTLVNSLSGMAARLGDCTRVARIMVITRSLDTSALDAVVQSQRPDGGWGDVEETMWCAALMRDAGLDSEHDAALAWLNLNESPGGAWGRSSRDAARVPHTALMFWLLRDAVVTSQRVEVLRALWEKDLAAQVRLTYKGGFVLLATSAIQAASLQELSGATINFLREQQNDDGGFGPWRNHPIGSDPWSTGVVLAGLCAFPEIVDRLMIERAEHWLAQSQLDSGYWAYHFIDEGTSYAYWGLSEAAKLLGNS